MPAQIRTAIVAALVLFTPHVSVGAQLPSSEVTRLRLPTAIVTRSDSFLAGQRSPRVRSRHSPAARILIGAAIGAAAGTTVGYLGSSGDRTIAWNFGLFGGALSAVGGYMLGK